MNESHNRSVVHLPLYSSRRWLNCSSLVYRMLGRRCVAGGWWLPVEAPRAARLTSGDSSAEP